MQRRLFHRVAYDPGDLEKYDVSVSVSSKRDQWFRRYSADNAFSQ